MVYQYLATSVAGFVQQLAVAYVSHGYLFYVTGKVPDHKDPSALDTKLIERYGLDVSKWTRARRKKEGAASVQYLRYGRFFVLAATHGEHEFFAEEGDQVRDIRKRPLWFMGYSISCRKGRDQKWHASVRIERELFRAIKCEFEDRAVHESPEAILERLQRLDFEAYAPVRQQIRTLLRAVNRRRKEAGLELVERSALILRRYPTKPFG